MIDIFTPIPLPRKVIQTTYCTHKHYIYIYIYVYIEREIHIHIPTSRPRRSAAERRRPTKAAAAIMPRKCASNNYDKNNNNNNNNMAVSSARVSARDDRAWRGDVGVPYNKEPMPCRPMPLLVQLRVPQDPWSQSF